MDEIVDCARQRFRFSGIWGGVGRVGIGLGSGSIILPQFLADRGGVALALAVGDVRLDVIADIDGVAGAGDVDG